MSNAKYISSILFDNSLSENSYLNDLPIIKYLAANKELKLSSNIIFLWARTVQVSPPCLKRLQLRMVLMLKAAQKTFLFLLKIPIQNFPSI